MLIAVNTRLLLKDKLEGIGWFTYESLKRITKKHSEHNFLFLFDRPFSEEFIFSDNITPIVVGPQARHPLLWYWWFEQSLPKIFHKHEPDLFLSPDGFLSLSYAAPSFATINIFVFRLQVIMNILIRKFYACMKTLKKISGWEQKKVLASIAEAVSKC